MTSSDSEHFRIAVRDMRDVKVGERVPRQFPGEHDFESGATMTLTVTKVDDELIHCGLWTFDRATGMEVDHDLRWGPMYGVTGTFLVERAGS